MPNQNIFKNNRPVLTIEGAGGKYLGHCFSSHFYRITSLHALSKKAMQSLRDAGMLGYGQGYVAEFLTHEGKREPLPEVVDWEHPVIPTVEYEVPCVEVNAQGEVVGPGINPYSKEPYKPIKIGYYVYMVEDQIDSGD